MASPTTTMNSDRSQRITNQTLYWIIAAIAVVALIVFFSMRSTVNDTNSSTREGTATTSPAVPTSPAQTTPSDTNTMGSGQTNSVNSDSDTDTMGTGQTTRPNTNDVNAGGTTENSTTGSQSPTSPSQQTNPSTNPTPNPSGTN
jgi:hypothetical protein